MKIEKLTDNKIRVIIHVEELGDSSHADLHNIMRKAMETQELFSGILKQAEQEVDFHTDGCKLLIEAFSSLEDVFVFTITKYLPDPEVKKKKLTVKRKSFDSCSKKAICEFKNLDVFGEFCYFVDSLHKINVAQLCKNISLYTWKNSYYLILKNVNVQNESLKLFYSTLSEFGKLLSCSEHFETKLLEHGKVLIKKNAITVGLQFFSHL